MIVLLGCIHTKSLLFKLKLLIFYYFLKYTNSEKKFIFHNVLLVILWGLATWLKKTSLASSHKVNQSKSFYNKKSYHLLIEQPLWVWHSVTFYMHFPLLSLEKWCKRHNIFLVLHVTKLRFRGPMHVTWINQVNFYVLWLKHGCIWDSHGLLKNPYSYA